MVDVAERASERAGDVVGAVVEGAVAEVEGALASAEARAEAAEELNETILESARRDALHDEIETLEEGLEECRNQFARDVVDLRTQNETLQSQLSQVQQQLTELLARPTTVAVSIPQPSAEILPETTPAAETVVTINPETVAAEVVPAAPVARPGKARRWI